MKLGDVREAVMMGLNERRFLVALFGYGAGLDVDVSRVASPISITDVTATLSRAYGEQTDTVEVSFNDAFANELGERNLIKWIVDEIEKQLRRLPDNGGKS